MSAMTLDDVAPPIPCVECGRPTDRRSISTLHETVGFAKKRKGGGLHGLTFAYETGRVMCQRCVRIRKETGNSRQGTLI